MAEHSSNVSDRGQDRDEVLDLVRGLSALVVMAAHVRGFVLKDLGELPIAGLGTKAFYLATGVHHQAVMVFFVLSGFFVGGAVVKALSAGRFSWGRYAVARPDSRACFDTFVRPRWSWD